jgi:hypothetical protein
MAFWTYIQNNSFGRFDVDEKIANAVIVEAASRELADERAEQLGIYFDGCDAGRDCNCCGDRWSRQQKHEGDSVPSLYGDPLHVTDWYGFEDHLVSRSGGVRLHFADGRVLKFEKRPESAEAYS